MSGSPAGGFPSETRPQQQEATCERKGAAEEQLDCERQRLSLFPCRSRETAHPGRGAARPVLKQMRVSPEDSRIHVATHEEPLDDGIREDLRKRTASGGFLGGIFEPPKDSPTDQLQSIDQLTGAKRLRGPDKEITRKDSVVSRRLATLSGCLSDENRPWLVWTDASARPRGEPTDLSEWAVVKRKGFHREDPSRGCRTTGNAAPAEPGRAGLGADHPLCAAELRLHPGTVAEPRHPKPPRLVRSEPHKTTLAEGAHGGRPSQDRCGRPESAEE